MSCHVMLALAAVARLSPQEPHHPHRLAVPLPDFDGGKSADRHAGRNIAHDAALGGDLGAGADRQMVGDADLAAHHDTIADHRAAGDADLAADDALSAKPHVVADMDEVIEHRTGTNHGIAGGAAIDRAVGADLDAVLDDDATELQHAHEALGTGDVAEALAADADASGDVDPGADQRVADGAIRRDPAAVAEDAAGTEDAVAAIMKARADLDIGSAKAAAVDLRPIADARG